MTDTVLQTEATVEKALKASFDDLYEGENMIKNEAAEKDEVNVVADVVATG